METINFDLAFEKLTDNSPFPWQQELYRRFISNQADSIPSSCNLPTGLGKTSIIAIWLIALANQPDKMPRRLVYVVNRRTVVDQTTDEVEKLRRRLPEVPAVLEALWELCSVRPENPDPEKDRPLAISTLRGQFADNREWSADPSRPAVICGTVDMIGSRLLFSGYGCGFKTRPLHAGFLGQDTLLVHDEAHLEPAFQKLIEAVRDEQKREPAPLGDRMRLKVMELTATSRTGDAQPFTLSDEDYKNATVDQRVNAKKKLHLHENKDEKKLAEEIGTLAFDIGKQRPAIAILVFVRRVDDVDKVTKKLPTGSFEQLTGTLRGLERDGLVKKPIFQRFLPESNREKGVKPQDGTVYLVCTSAGEVGVNISADHLVCDLSTFESMAQRFGRVNRFGLRDDTEIHVVHPTKFADKDEGASRLKITLGLLELLNGNASPAALAALRERAIKEGSSTEPPSSDRVKALREYVLAHQDTDPRLGGYAPQPIILPTSDILFDSWALTTIRELPGRPPVAGYLHGVEDEKQRETYVGWRAEVELFHKAGIDGEQIAELLDQFPLKPHELLRDNTWRVQAELAELAKDREDLPVCVIEPDESVRVLSLGNLADKDKKAYAINLIGRTVILPPAAGGLTATGTLNGTEKYDPERRYDVAGWFLPASRVPLVRLLVQPGEEEATYKLVAPVLNLPADFQFQLDGEKEAAHLRKAFPDPFPPMRVAYRIDLVGDEDKSDNTAGYLVLKPEPRKEQAKHSAAWPSLATHLASVKAFAEAICSGLHLPPDVARAASLAAAWHDLGKDRAVWQRGAGNNRRDTQPVAKTLHGRPPENLNHFRHELASMVDVRFDPEYKTAFEQQTNDSQELLLHLIATHHGRGRPHFPATEATDPERPASASELLVCETPGRFARLQRQYSRWGLAYLESLLRAADALDSKRIEETPVGGRESGNWPRPTPKGVVWASAHKPPAPSISVNVDPTNPGQFFACCGLLELADRLWPGAEGWFAERDGEFSIAGGGDIVTLVQKVSTAELTLIDSEDIYSGRVRIGNPFRPLLLDWWHEYGGRKDAKDLKVWAGTMESHGIAHAMQHAMRGEQFRTPDLFNVGMVVPDPDDSKKKKEPYYFDARRGPNAHTRDVGFSANTLDLTTTAFPAVEFLCLVGIQRCLPAKTETARIYDYFTWSEPLSPALLPAAVSGSLAHLGSRGYRFENWFRTGQRKHKAFRSAIPLSLQGAQ